MPTDAGRVLYRSDQLQAILPPLTDKSADYRERPPRQILAS